jgi:hypothetical protein
MALYSQYSHLRRVNYNTEHCLFGNWASARIKNMTELVEMNKFKKFLRFADLQKIETEP